MIALVPILQDGSLGHLGIRNAKYFKTMIGLLILSLYINFLLLVASLSLMSNVMDLNKAIILAHCYSKVNILLLLMMMTT